jgi:hypothetical protein
MMAAMVAVTAATMEAADVETVERAWVKDEAEVVRAEEMVAAAVEAMKARMSGVRRREW